MPRLTAPTVAALPEEQPVLTAGDLLLRPWEPSDAPDVQAAYEDPDVQRWHVFRLDDAEAADYATRWRHLWETGVQLGWAVVRDGRLVGRATLTHLDLADGQAEVTYWTVPAARRTGVAAGAVGALTTWAFSLGFHRLELSHSTRNEASCRVALSSGYLLEGTRQRSALHLDGWHDMHLHARLAQEPE